MKKTIIILLLAGVYSLHAQIRTDSIHVVNYDINLSIVDFTNKTIEGYTKLNVVSKVDNLSLFQLNFKSSFSIDSIILDKQPYTNYSFENDLLTFHLNNIISTGDTLEVFVYYQGVPFGNNWGGFTFSGEYMFNMGAALYEVPHSYGRVWFPCIDDFTDKSVYSFSICTESHKTAICNGLLKDSTHLADNTILWRWELQDPIPAYLASVAVGEYELYKDIFHSVNSSVIPIEIYAPPAYVNNVPSSFTNLKTILRHYEACFIPYPRERIGYVLVDFNNGAMEHSTNIAYPYFAVNGTSGYEGLYAHELSHEWFGNLITCEKAEEMWINEGLATYCALMINEVLYKDENPDIDGLKVGVRDLHRSVLTTTYLADGGYYALNNVPLENTYGSTTYDKGGLIVHTLRNYLGDSLFFKGMKSMLAGYAFKNISSEGFFSHLSQSTSVNLTDFYEAYINQPGFFHFSIDSIRKSAGNNQYRVYVRQRLHAAESFANSNRIDLTFFDRNRNSHTVEKFEFSGEYEQRDITVPFEPEFGIVDFHEKLADAVIDYNLYLTKKGEIIYDLVFMRVNITDIEDTVFMRLEHNLVKPDELKNDNPLIYRISDNHYWRVEYVGNATGELYFKYSSAYSYSPDYKLMQGYTEDNLKLLYRRDASQDWQAIPCVRGGSAINGLFKTSLLPGEYTLAVADPNLSIDKYIENNILVYPNPTSGMVDISISDKNITCFSIFDMQGKRILTHKVNSELMQVDLEQYTSGSYVFKFYKNKKQVEKAIKIIKQ